MIKAKQIQKELKLLSNPKQAKILQGFFKTGPGQYGAGDIFLGVKVGPIRKIALKYQNLDLQEVIKLLPSKIHEERQVALFILTEQFKKADQIKKKKIFNLYLKNTKHINNWDLVDLSAPKIVGQYLSDQPRKKLYQLAVSRNLWSRRIAMLACFAFIKNNDFKDALKIAKILLKDQHDLIHKAVGWMLREIGKRNQKIEEKFLKQHYQQMPRTMLRYAIERFSVSQRKKYLKK